MRNKFTDLQTIINGNVDIASIAETKLAASFPSTQFTLEGHHNPYRLDINQSGGILAYVKSSIPSRCFAIKSYVFLYRLFLLRLIWERRNG